MKITKILSKQLNRAYATSLLKINEKDYIFYASESTVGIPGLAYAFDLNDLNNPEIVWNNAGGCMAILPHPYFENSFVAVQEFYLKENPSKAKLVIGTREKDGSWTINDLISVPLVHRFGFIKDEDCTYLIICTVAKQKDNKDDWSKPGEILVAPFPKNPNEPINLSLLKTGLYKNHGFYQFKENGKDVICVGSDNGAFKIMRKNNNFVVEKILDGQIGEVALHDIDNDGKLELLTIEPFHGNKVRLYHLNENNTYERVWEYENNVDFAHALAGGRLLNHECFIVGVRKGNGEAFILYQKDNKYCTELIDQGKGPANLCIINTNKKDYVSCANHTLGECALYEVEF